MVKLYAAGLLARAVPGQRSYCAVEAYDALGLGAMPSPA